MAIGRKRLIAGLGLISLGLAMTGVMVASRWRGGATDEYAGWSLGIESGRVQLVSNWMLYRGRGRNEDYGPVDPPKLYWTLPGAMPKAYEHIVDVPIFGVFRMNSPKGGVVWSVGFMLWPIVLAAFATGVPLVWSARRIRRRTRKGLCHACSYDLSGLAAGTACPECGKGK
ncbi:MAG: hypothetical protein AABZ53_14140 [Planctomycetota bacterium]